MTTTKTKPAMRGTCPTYTVEELSVLPAGTPVVCYGRQVSFYITHGGREIQSRGTFFKLGYSKIDGKRYAFWKLADGSYKKMPAEGAARCLGFDKSAV